MNEIKYLVEKSGERVFVSAEELAARLKDGWTVIGQSIYDPENPIKPAKPIKGATVPQPQAPAEKSGPKGKGKAADEEAVG